MRSPVPISVVLALLLFALPAAFAAMVTFERLQQSRLDFFDKFVTDLRRDGPRAIPPDTVSKYAYWLARTEYPVSADARRRTMLARYPQAVAQRKLIIVGAFFGGTLLAWTLLWMLSYRRKVLPLATSHGERFWAVCGAMRAAWLWSMATAVLAAALTWYIGFARDEQPAPLEEGLWPRAVQLACLVAAWMVMSLAACVVLLPRSLARVVGAAIADRVLCARCGYSLVGLDGKTCPECGASGAAAQWDQNSRRVFTRRVARRAIIGFTAAAVLLGCAATFSSQARDWLLLRPRYAFPEWEHTGWIASGESPLRWESVYGVLNISGTLRERTAQDEAVWRVTWTFEPVSNFKAAATAGTLEIPVTASAPKRSDWHQRELPCGPMAFYSKSDDPRLHVVAPFIIFPELAGWNRPFPPP